MTQVFLYCSDSHGFLLDRRVAYVADLFEARDYARGLVRSLMATARLKDWRSCRVHVRDERDEEIFVMPFWSILGLPALEPRSITGFTFSAWS